MNHPVSVNTFHKFACFQSFILLITKHNYFIIIILPIVIYHYTAISLAFRTTSREPIMVVQKLTIVFLNNWKRADEYSNLEGKPWKFFQLLSRLGERVVVQQPSGLYFIYEMQCSDLMEHE